MGIRERKGTLLAALKGYVLTGSMTIATASRFEARYRSCRSMEEQETVRKDVHHVVSGFRLAPKTVYDRLRADDDDDDDDDLSPALLAAIERARVDVRR